MARDVVPAPGRRSVPRVTKVAIRVGYQTDRAEWLDGAQVGNIAYGVGRPTPPLVRRIKGGALSIEEKLGMLGFEIVPVGGSGMTGRRHILVDGVPACQSGSWLMGLVGIRCEGDDVTESAHRIKRDWPGAEVSIEIGPCPAHPVAAKAAQARLLRLHSKSAAITAAVVARRHRW